MQELQQGTLDTWNELQLHLIAVDTPSPTLDYTSRVSTLKQTLSNNQYLKSVEATHCKGQDHLQQLISNAAKLGCEGVILRKSASYYYEPASVYVLKVSGIFRGNY